MPNPVVHFEIHAVDGDQLHQFYGDLFGWQIQPMPELHYGLIDTQTDGRGIGGGISSTGTARTIVYVEVDDLQATLDQAEQLGAKTLMPVTEIPNVVTLAIFEDPQGNQVGLIKSKPM
jgi:uncharacterized protein